VSKLPQFAEKAEFQIHFQPFQLYPDLPSGDHEGVDKRDFFKRLGDMRAPDRSEEDKLQRRKDLKAAWEKDGLQLSFNGSAVRPEGLLGNSLDAQRLIMLAREQGVEDAMIEAIYTANHVNNQCLSDWKVLLACAEQAGVEKAEEKLKSGYGKQEVIDKVMNYHRMGINAVPVLVVDNKHTIHGAPEHETLAALFTKLIEEGDSTFERQDHSLASGL